MKKIIVLLLAIAFLTNSSQAEKPCYECMELTKVLVSKVSYNKKATAYADFYIHIETTQKEVLRKIVKLRKADRKTILRAKKTYPKLVASIKRLKLMKRRFEKKELKQDDYLSLINKIRKDGVKAVLHADKLIDSIMSDDSGGGTTIVIQADCSGAGERVFSSCKEGVKIKQECGYYKENGGARAVNDELASCMAAANAAIANCQLNPDSSVMDFMYIDAAMMVCDEVEEGGLETAPKKQTLYGN